MVVLSRPASLLILCLALACKDRREQTYPLRGPITESVYASGIIKSVDQYHVFANASGLVAVVLVTEGDLVKKGDPLMKLSDTTARLSEDYARLTAAYSATSANTDRLRELQVTIEQSHNKLSNDSLLLERQRQLWQQNIGTRNELEQRELNYRNSKGNYHSAVLRYNELQRQINLQEQQTRKSWKIAHATVADLTVRSEVDGKVYSVLKKKGELVTPQTPIAVVGKSNNFLLELQVDEFDIAQIRPGLKVLLTMDSYKGQVFEAQISKIYPMMNAGSKTFSVEALLTKTPPVLYPNLTCEANIIVQEKADALTIPASFLLPGDSVLLPGGKKTGVRVGARDYRKAEILTGITEKDIIIKPEQ